MAGGEFRLMTDEEWLNAKALAAKGNLDKTEGLKRKADAFRAARKYTVSVAGLPTKTGWDRCVPPPRKRTTFSLRRMR